MAFFPSRKNIDWSEVESDYHREYLAGKLPLSAIAERHGLSESWLWKQATKRGWPKLDRSSLVRSGVADTLNANVGAAVTSGVALVLEHREDLAEARRLIRGLAKKSIDDAELEIKRVTAVTTGLSRIVPLERTAWNVEDGGKPGTSHAEALEDLA